MFDGLLRGVTKRLKCVGRDVRAWDGSVPAALQRQVAMLLLSYITFSDNELDLDEHTKFSAICALINGLNKSFLFFGGVVLCTVQGLKSAVYLTALLNSCVHADVLYAMLHFVISHHLSVAGRDCEPSDIVDMCRFSIASDDSRVGIPDILIVTASKSI